MSITHQEIAEREVSREVLWTMPIGTTLIMTWFEGGFRNAPIEIMSRTKETMILARWRPNKRSERLTLEREGKSHTIIEHDQLAEKPDKKEKGWFRVWFLIPNHLEVASIEKLYKAKFPRVPLEGQYVRVVYDDPGDGEPELYGVVKSQLVTEMTISTSYYSVKQSKVIVDPISFNQTDQAWADLDTGSYVRLEVIDKPTFDAWLAEDERKHTQRATMARLKASDRAKRAVTPTLSAPKAPSTRPTASKAQPKPVKKTAKKAR